MKVKAVSWGSEPELSPYGNEEWILIRSWTVQITYSDDTTEFVVIESGFTTDLASVFRLPLMYWIFGGRARRSAVIHDWMYRTGKWARRIADAVFLIAAKAEENTVIRHAMFAGVRVGGWWAYRGENAD